MPLWDEQLELAVLGAALTHPNAARLVVERCEADDFYLLRHQRVLAEVSRLLDAGERPDSVGVSMAFPSGERPYVRSLPSYCAVAVNASRYVERLRCVSARRRLALVMDRVEPRARARLARSAAR